MKAVVFVDVQKDFIDHQCFCVGSSFENSQELESNGVVDFDV